MNRRVEGEGEERVRGMRDDEMDRGMGIEVWSHHYGGTQGGHEVVTDIWFERSKTKTKMTK